ncbi:insulinase family protein [Parasphaerochaeta coccoides]|uniref:Peptidase M16 domain protein n=1 Tax=Parasphaerochaeta coccoides (strain ATCC BAA-1237 / DSM 17374 / SPN1) TaxID=760011 RepID=F4GI62_PARC1|nr:insulinase family protein [Parasphaerochaeta coccoides]AEC02660.1 peptidase M16 domain protein [Parasphaerochaeta coccoides DSM 17374]
MGEHDGENPCTLKIGDELHSFVLVSIDNLPDYEAKGYLFQHIITKMEVYQVINADVELFFGFTFKTPPNNDSGVAHIIEHSVLAGSRRYPVRDPFMTLLKGSANTFMNAMTYSDRTSYPAASPSRKDFDNLFAVYADAVFAPLLREETFQQEGVRQVPHEDGTITFDGVVLNEMKGGADHDTIVGLQSVRTLFPDTPYAFDSGGDPEAIINLDYKQFKAFYGQYYHPGNCKLLMYGALEPGDKLEFLENAYLGQYSAIEVPGAAPLPEKWLTPRQAVAYSPVEHDGKAEDVSSGASVTLSWATTSAEDPLQVYTLSTLVDVLLGNPGAPLYKAITESKLGLDICPESGMSSEFRLMPFVVGFKGISPDKAQQAESFLMKTLTRIVKTGIPRDEVEAALKRLEFSLAEIPGGYPNGLRAMNRSLHGWLQGLPPASTIASAEPVKALREAVAVSYAAADEAKDPSMGWFESWMFRNLVENPHRCLLTVIPDPQYLTRRDQTMAKKAEQIRSGMDKQGFKDFQDKYARFLQFEESGDAPDALATIPRLRLSDLPLDIRRIEKKSVEVSGRPTVMVPLFTNGIVYADFAFTLDDLTVQEILDLSIYVRLLQMTGMKGMDYSQVAMRIRSLTGSFSIAFDAGSTVESAGRPREEKSLLMVRFSALERDFAEACAFAGDLLRHADVKDVGRIAAAITDMRTEYSNGLLGGANVYAAQRAGVAFSMVGQQAEATGGLAHWLMLDGIDIKNASGIKGIASRLVSLQEKLAMRERLVIQVTGDASREKQHIKILESFVEGFPEFGDLLIPVSRDFGLNQLPERELFRIPATVSYTAIVTSSAPAGSSLQAAQQVLGTLLTTNGLWTRIRGNGGAYGVSSSLDLLEQLFVFTTYRDPRIAGSIADYMDSLEELVRMPPDASTVEDALILTVGKEIRPLSPRQKAGVTFRRDLYGFTDDFRAHVRSLVCAVRPEDIAMAAADILERLKAHSRTVILGGKSLLEKEGSPSTGTPVVISRLPL